jgi:hypothetical protein
MTVKEYYAKSSAKFTNADAKVIGPVLGELSERGPVTARDVVDLAHSSNSPLHKYFEWDDARAADMHRLGVAREMVKTIRVKIIGNNNVQRVPAASITVAPVKLGTEFYDATLTFSKDAKKKERIAKAYSDLRGWLKENNDYFRLYAEFEDSFGDVKRAIEALEYQRDGRITPKRRFTDHAELQPEKVMGLPDDNAAVREGRTLFPSTVVAPADSPALLVSGENSRKLGSKVTKGPWSGFPIYQLSLEERATCPRSCFHWNTCYGNGMQMARRHKADGNLIPYLKAELTDLQDEFPRGFAVRLHVLGDFFNLQYVDAWREFLDDFSALHVFGYTAHPKDSEIGAALLDITDELFDRFAIRFSSEEPQAQGATTIWRMPEDDNVRKGIVCPAQTGKTDCCGTCGLCWAVSAKDKTIAFIAHGRTSKTIEPIKAPSRARLMGGR